ncbi:peptidyl-prolyl cis-trans isomerase FKBP14 isoform X1 [Strongylocentrotus purpuratus]|uniref:peptidylprolyl isomerase n=1 Tax=Strongylocentrotus purpuratus TaxID=7668 RepID=A0A7M7HPH7_STRPU|nr:peptidyl-prolyl cis-trans isomerase FKBP14 isoform X1 [Strongylocentrotus purpuratus]|eukprot:XP_011680537.1 PREDICTED: peptidyl-prolyl cis-trans isomerase FKBP14 isoform X1 [Strongylocentrotus purpuratus]
MNTMKMAFSICIALIVTVVALVAGEVNINVLFKPEDCQRTAQSGDYVTVTYVAFLADESGNERFDNTDNTGPVNFRLNDKKSTAMQGWHQGLEGACLREKREVLIPAGQLTLNHRLPNSKPPPKGKDVGYTFEVRNIQDSPPAENLFKKMDFDENKEISKDEMKAYLSKQGLGGMREEETLDGAINNIFENKDHDRSNSLSSNEFFGHNAHEEL